jgi:hypothetical protein
MDELLCTSSEVTEMTKGVKEMGVVETAVATNRTLTHVYNLIRLGRFPGAEKVNGEWRIPTQAVMAYLEECKRRDEMKIAA